MRKSDYCFHRYIFYSRYLVPNDLKIIEWIIIFDTNKEDTQISSLWRKIIRGREQAAGEPTWVSFIIGHMDKRIPAKVVMLFTIIMMPKISFKRSAESSFTAIAKSNHC